MMLTLQHLTRPWKRVCATFFVIAAVFSAMFVLAMFGHRFIPAMVCAAVAGIALITAFNMMTPSSKQQVMIQHSRSSANMQHAQANIEKVISYALLAGGGTLAIAFIVVLLQGLLLLAAALAGFIFGCMVSTWCVYRYMQARMKHVPVQVKE